MQGLPYLTRRHVLALLVPLAAALSGCAVSGEQLAPLAYDRPWTPANNAAGEIVPAPARAALPDARGGYVLPANPALATLPTASGTDPEHLYTLIELVDLAHSANPRGRIAWYEARNAAVAAGIVRSSYAPRVSITGAAGAHANRSTVSAFGLRGGDEGDGTSAVATLSLEWLVFDFGAREALVNAARQQSVMANIAFTAEHQQVTYQVALAFYDDVAARARSGNADRAVALALDVQTAAQARLRQGIGTAVEVAQARQATAQVQLAAVQARAAVSDARLRLLTAIGVPPFTRLRIADTPARPLTPRMADMAEQAIAQALSRRPDMLAALAGAKASAEGVRATRADVLPKVFAAGTASHIEGARNITALPGVGGESPTLNLSGARTSAALMVGIRLPLFDGGIRAARLDQARNRVEVAAAQMDETRNRAVLEIVASENGLRSSLEANVAAGEARVAAQTTVDAALAAYRSGVGSVTEANLAQQHLLAAENVGADAHAAALRAAATLALATGALGSAPD